MAFVFSVVLNLVDFLGSVDGPSRMDYVLRLAEIVDTAIDYNTDVILAGWRAFDSDASSKIHHCRFRDLAAIETASVRPLADLVKFGYVNSP